MKKLFDATGYFVPKGWFFGFEWDHRNSKVIDSQFGRVHFERFYTLGICVLPMFKLQVLWNRKITEEEFEDEHPL